MFPFSHHHVLAPLCPAQDFPCTGLILAIRNRVGHMQIVTSFSSVDSANARYLRAKKMGSASYTKHRSARRGVSWLPRSSPAVNVSRPVKGYFYRLLRAIIRTDSSTYPGKNLKELRARLAITVREVAEESQPEFFVSNNWLTRLENTDAVPSIHKLFSLSAVYRVKVSDLLPMFGINQSLLEKYCLPCVLCR